MTWMDYSWIGVIVLLILAIAIDMTRKKRKTVRRTVKNIPLSPYDWSFIEATIEKRKTTLANFIGEQLKRYADEHSR